MDVRLPGMSGLDAMSGIRKRLPDVPIIVMTAFGDLETAVEAVRNGASEYLVKPFDLARAGAALERVLRRPKQALPQLPEEVEGIVGRSPPMQEVFRKIALAGIRDACVLVTGESGTGKELVARAIHRYSTRSEGPFIAVNLAALNPTLAESELFGHVKGSFTGAEQNRTGLLTAADGGTLFLDEVADIPLSVQAKLLRVLDHGEVLPVGAGAPHRSDFRLVTATHQDLAAKVRAGTFRHDLYFRLSTFQIELPPLRERGDDIGLLIEYFARRMLRDPGASPRISQQAVEHAKKRKWWGNVRELRNAVEHALMLAGESYLMPEHWPSEVPSLLTEAPSRDPLTELRIMVAAWVNDHLKTKADEAHLYEAFLALVEPPLLQEALRRNKDQCATAARMLGMHRITLRKKLDQYGIQGEDGE
ncbi:MAG: sigma-54 dependent transcriptional regulator [Pirellulales bacterium]